jgi:nicotinamidase-related amidase
MKTALLVIDAQRIYTEPGSELFCKDSRATINRINKLIAKFQSEGRPIVLVRHCHRKDGTDLGRMFDYSGEPVDDFNFKAGTPEVEYDSRLERPSSPIEITKTRYSAFAGTELDRTLHGLGVGRVVVCGFMTNCCCDSTAREAHDKDYFVDFIVDATGTPGTEAQEQAAVRRAVADLMENAYARVLTTRKCLSSDYD